MREADSVQTVKKKKKAFANEDTHKNLNSKTYKELMHLNMTNTDNPRRKYIYAKDQNGYLVQEGIQVGIRPIKRCSASVIIREKQIKSAMRHPFEQVRMAIFSKIYKD